MTNQKADRATDRSHQVRRQLTLKQLVAFKRKTRRIPMDLKEEVQRKILISTPTTRNMVMSLNSYQFRSATSRCGDSTGPLSVVRQSIRRYWPRFSRKLIIDCIRSLMYQPCWNASGKHIIWVKAFSRNKDLATMNWIWSRKCTTAE